VLLLLALLAVPAAAQQPRTPETVGGTPPPVAPAVPAGPYVTAGPLLYKTSLDIGDAGFSVYDPATDAWTQLTPYETGAQMAVSPDKELFAFGYGTGTIDVYDPATDTWSAVLPAPPGATGQYGNLEITVNGEFLYTEAGGATLYYTVGGAWNTLPLPFTTNVMGDYEPATNQYVIGQYGTTNAHLIDLDTWAITDYTSGVGNGEYARFSVVMDNMYFFEAGGSPINYFDLGNPAAPPVDTGTVLGWYSSASADRWNHTIYVASLDGTQLWRYDVPTNTATPLTGGSGGWHSSLAFVDTSHEPSNELHINRNKIFQHPSAPMIVKVVTQWEIFDQNGMPVEGALMAGEWTLPDGTIVAGVPSYGLTDVLGHEKFRLMDVQTGVYNFCVTSITKAGYFWDPGDPLKCLSIDILP
jgi:hypothetical protein